MTLPMPYCDRDGIVIYHARCEDVLPHLDPADVALVTLNGVLPTHEPSTMPHADHLRRYLVPDAVRRVRQHDAPFDPALLLRFPRLVLFGANHYADRLPSSGGWLAWDKTGGGRGPDNSFADVELAWTNVARTPTIYHHLWKGLVRDSEAGHPVLHPTQKPVALMRWILDRWTKPGDLVLDPYMGSGPVARAAMDLGRRYIGVECVEAYCQVAVKRLAQGVLDLSGGAA